MSIDFDKLTARHDPTRCSVPDCGEKILKKGFCLGHHRDRWCPAQQGSHDPLPWSISPCDNGQVVAKCMHCKSAYLFEKDARTRQSL
jgi:DNA-directed RNA polymerase subunit RPC12/RpoP